MTVYKSYYKRQRPKIDHRYHDRLIGDRLTDFSREGH